MDLKEFVSTTLNEIVSAVYEANQNSKGQIAPYFNLVTPDRNLVSVYDGEKHILITEVRFELSVQAEESTAASGKGKVTVIPTIMTGSVGGETTSKNLALNKIAFSVPVKLAEDKGK